MKPVIFVLGIKGTKDGEKKVILYKFCSRGCARKKVKAKKIKKIWKEGGKETKEGNSGCAKKDEAK